MRRHDDDRQLRGTGLQAFQQFQPVDTGHADVGHEDVRQFVLQGIQQFGRAGEALDVHAVAHQ